GATLIATTWTDTEGGYLFADVPAGVAYRVVVTPTAGLNPTYDEDGTASASFSQTPAIVAEVEHLSADFGYNWVTPGDSANPGPATTGAIGDRVWNDANGNGQQDAGEAGLGGVTVRLLTDDNADGTYGGAGDDPASATSTAADGGYVFDGLAAGAYVVEVDDATLPAGATWTQTGDPDATSDHRTTDPVVLAPGDVFVNADFGYQPNHGSAIGDTVYLDANGNGAQDAQEPGIVGVSVALVQDLNTNSIWDAGEPVIATDLTDAAGNYLFDGLPAGDYLVVVTDTDNVLGGLVQTGDPDGGFDGRSAASVDGNADNLTQDHGYAPLNHGASDGLIGDTVFLDRDGDSAPDADEGLEGVTVELYSGITLLASATTDENGHYQFGNLIASGAYTVRVDASTLPNGGVGLSNTVDPDGGLASEATLSLTSLNPVNLAQDFGYRAAVPNQIGGTLWNDANANGTLDSPGEASGYGGVTVELRDSNGNLVGTTNTAANGDYSFTGLPDGGYTVHVTDTANVLNGLWKSDGGNDGTDGNSQPDAYGVTVGGGQTNSTGDFGYYGQGAALGNRVWSDTDGDGVQEAGEPGLANVRVSLTIIYEVNGGNVTTTLVDITDGSGGYRFGNLLLDENHTGQGGNDPTFEIAATTPANHTASPAGQGGDAKLDSDDHAGVAASVVKGQTSTDLLANPANEGANASYDFGYEPPAGSVAVSGTVFHDLSQDKLQGGGEPGTNASGQLYVTALDGSSQPVASVAVGGNGSYSLSLPTGASYTLVLTTSLNGTTPLLPANWSNTGENRDGTPDGGAGDGVLTVTVAYAPVGGQNFGIDGAPPHADDDSATTPHDTNVDLPARDNDDLGPGAASFDPASIDLDPSTPGVVDITRTVSGEGTYTVNQTTGVVTFDPLPGFSGPATPVPYVVKDDLGQATNTANLRVVVGPLAQDDVDTTPFNTPKNGSVTGNDQYPAGSVFSQIGSGTTHGGQVTVNPDGSYSYTPPTGFTGTDSFTYQVCLAAPNGSLCDPATVSITITVTCTAICDVVAPFGVVNNSDLTWISANRLKRVTPAGAPNSGDCVADGLLSVNDVTACKAYRTP
ncbi:SdrD B-like domain-containing protein, partial [Methylomagnum sp.]